MTDENITVSGGILLVRSESGRSKLEKVLVETKPGQTKSRVKCRLQRFVNETMAPFLIRSNKKDNIPKGVHSSLTNIHRNSLIMDGDGDFEVPRIHGKNDKDTEIPNLQMIYSQGSIHFLQHDPRRLETISSSKKLDSEIALMESKESHIHEAISSPKKLDSEIDDALLRTEQIEIRDPHIYEAVSSSKKSDSELDGTFPTKEHKEDNQDESGEIENNASLPNLFKIDSETNTLYENETKNEDSTIHIPYSDDDDDFEADDDELTLEPITKFQKYNQLGEDPAKVKAQYSSPHKPHGGGEHSEPEDDDDEDEDDDYDTDDEDDDSYDIDVDDRSKYIDSGLRRLKSDESRLFVLPVIYKTKRRPPSYDDGVKPVLGEISSDVFHEPETPTRSEDVIVPQSSFEKITTDASTDDDASKTPSEGSDIDTKPLERLKELEDTTFTISTEGLVPADVPSETSALVIPSKIPSKVVKDKDDICVHTKGPSDDLIFSSSDIKPRKKKKKSSIFRIFRKKDDFCVHTADPGGSDYSTTALDKKRQKDICVHTDDPAGKSDYSSTTVDESKTIKESTTFKNKSRERSNFSSRDMFDQKRKESTNKLSQRSKLASSTVIEESAKTRIKPLQRLPERGNFASETVFDQKPSQKLARRNNPPSATYFDDSIKKREASKRKLTERSYFASTSVFDQRRENSLNKLPTRTNLRSTNDVYDDSIRNKEDSLNKLEKRGRSSTRSLHPDGRRSSSKGSSQHSRNISTISLIDNKEARRSKYSKIKMRRSSKDI